MDFQLSRRPLCVTLFIFLVSLFLSSLFFSPLKLAFALLLLVFLSLIVCIFRKNQISALACVIIVPIIFSLVLSYAAFDLLCLKKLQAASGTHKSAELVIIEKTGDYDYYVSYTAYLKSVDNKKAGVMVRLSTSFASDYETGDLIRLDEPQIEPSFTKLSLKESYNLSRGILCQTQVDDENKVTFSEGDVAIFPYTHCAKLRASISHILARYLEGDSLALSKALMYGDKSFLSSNIKNAFSALGISHALAISGLHLGILMGFMTLLLSLFKLKKSARLIVVLVSGLVYSFVAGLSPSILRAYFMYAIYILSEFSRRRKDPPTTLAAAVSVICILSPKSILDIGLHLSFFSTLGIITLGARIIKSLRQAIKNRFSVYVLSVCILTLCANLFTLPYTIYYFGYISLISPISNLIFLPLITLCVYLIPCIVLFSFIPFIAFAISFPVKALSSLIIFLCRGFYSFSDGFTLSFDGSFAKAAGIVAICLILLCLICFKRKYTAFIPFGLYLVSLMCLYIVSFTVSYNDLKVIYLTDGRSDALSFVSHNRATLVENSFAGYSFLSDAIERTEEDGVTKVDCLVLTHFHTGTLSSISRIIEDYPAIESLVLFIDEPDLEFALRENAEKRGVNVSVQNYGDSVYKYYYTLRIDASGAASHPLISLSFESTAADILYSPDSGDNKDEKIIAIASNHSYSNEKYDKLKKTVVFCGNLT